MCSGCGRCGEAKRTGSEANGLGPGINLIQVETQARPQTVQNNVAARPRFKPASMGSLPVRQQSMCSRRSPVTAQ